MAACPGVVRKPHQRQDEVGRRRRDLDLTIQYNTIQLNVPVPSLQKRGQLCITVSVNIWDDSYEEKAQLCDLNARLKAGQLSILRSAIGRLFHTKHASQTEFVCVVRRQIW